MDEEPRRVRTRTQCGLKVKNIVRYIGSLVVPLLLAVFTVVITFQQRDEATQQRIQDLNISREQREQDKRNADEKRNADDINADKQRNMSRDQRQHELEIEQQRYDQERTKYLDNLLLSYYKEIGELLKETNGTLSSNPIASALSRAKTLNVIEQVGPIKSVFLIKFLYDTNQLSLGSQSIDLTGAQLNNIDLSRLQTLQNVYFKGAYMNNASFAGRNLSNAQFLNVQLRGANFSHTNISFAFFQSVDLSESTFREAAGIDVHFEYCKMEQIDFTNVHLNTSEDSGVFRGFIDSTLSSSVFRNSFLVAIRFHFCIMIAVDFTSSSMKKVDLTGSILAFSVFRSARLQFVVFLSTNLSHADFRNSSCPDAYCNSTLSTALSIGSLISTDGKVNKPSTSLISYEHPQCNSSIPLPVAIVDSDKWRAQPEGSVFLQYRTLTCPHLHKDGCVFTAKSTFSTQVNLTHRISLSKYTGLVRANRAKATVRCRVGFLTQVHVTQMNSKDRELSRSDAIGLRWQGIIHYQADSMIISIEFRVPNDRESTWCLYIELHIEPIIKAPGYQLLHPWDTTEM